MSVVSDSHKGSTASSVKPASRGTATPSAHATNSVKGLSRVVSSQSLSSQARQSSNSNNMMNNTTPEGGVNSSGSGGAAATMAASTSSNPAVAAAAGGGTRSPQQRNVTPPPAADTQQPVGTIQPPAADQPVTTGGNKSKASGSRGQTPRDRASSHFNNEKQKLWTIPKVKVDWNDISNGDKNDPMPWLSKDSTERSKASPEKDYASFGLLGGFLNGSSSGGSNGGGSSGNLGRGGSRKGDKSFYRGFGAALIKHKTVEERLGLKLKKEPDSREGEDQKKKARRSRSADNGRLISNKSFQLVDVDDGEEEIPLVQTVTIDGGTTPRDGYPVVHRDHHDKDDDDYHRGNRSRSASPGEGHQPRSSSLRIDYAAKKNKIPLRHVMTPRDRVELQEMQEASPFINKESHGDVPSPRKSIQQLMYQGGLNAIRYTEGQDYTPRLERSRSRSPRGGHSPIKRLIFHGTNKNERSDPNAKVLDAQELAHTTLNEREFQLEMEVAELQLELKQARQCIKGVEQHFIDLGDVALKGVEDHGEMVVDIMGETVRSIQNTQRQMLEDIIEKREQKRLERERAEAAEEASVIPDTSPLTRAERIKEAKRRAFVQASSWSAILFGNKNSKEVLTVVSGLSLIAFFVFLLFHLTLYMIWQGFAAFFNWALIPSGFE